MNNDVKKFSKVKIMDCTIRDGGYEDILRTLETVKEMRPVGFKKPLLDSIIQSGFVGIF